MDGTTTPKGHVVKLNCTSYKQKSAQMLFLHEVNPRHAKTESCVCVIDMIERALLSRSAWRVGVEQIRLCMMYIMLYIVHIWR